MTTRDPAASTAMATGKDKGRPRPILASDTISRFPVTGSTRTTASSPASTTTRDPGASTATASRKIKGGTIADEPPHAVPARRRCLYNRTRSSGRRCRGRLAPPPSALHRPPPKRAVASMAMPEGMPKGGPSPISASTGQLRCASIARAAGHDRPVAGEGVDAHHRPATPIGPSTTTRRPWPRRRYPRHAEGRALPDKRLKAITLRIDRRAAGHDRPVAGVGVDAHHRPQPRIDHDQGSRGLYGKACRIMKREPPPMIPPHSVPDFDSGAAGHDRPVACLWIDAHHRPKPGIGDHQGPSRLHGKAC